MSPERLNAFTEEAVEWFSEQTHDDPTAFSDALLRDKVDEFIFHVVFGPERQIACSALFRHIYRGIEAR